MRLFTTTLFTILFFSSFSQISFRSGNVELDANLNIINDQGNSDFESFKQDLSESYNIPKPKLEEMKVSIGMEPGEIFMALEIVKNSKSTLTQVLDIYKKDKSKGWGYIAKQAGIKPGSAAFHQLKDNAKGRKGKAKGKPTRVKVKQQTSVKAKGKSKGKGNGKGN